jgi:hypothetical protein
MDLKLTGGDLAIENDDLVLLDGVDAVAQHVTTSLKTFQGEWFLDTRIGFPYFDRVLGQKPRLNELEQLYREAILAVPGMLTIEDLNIDFDGATRLLSVSFRGTCTDGVIEYDEEFII